MALTHEAEPAKTGKAVTAYQVGLDDSSTDNERWVAWGALNKVSVANVVTPRCVNEKGNVRVTSTSVVSMGR